MNTAPRAAPGLPSDIAKPMSDLPKPLNLGNLPPAAPAPETPPDVPKALKLDSAPALRPGPSVGAGLERPTPPSALQAAAEPKALFGVSLRPDDPVLAEARRIAPELAETKAFQSVLTALRRNHGDAVVSQWGGLALESCRAVSDAHTGLTGRMAQLRITEWLGQALDLVLRPPSMLQKLKASVTGESAEVIVANIRHLQGELRVILEELEPRREEAAKAKRELQYAHLSLMAFLAARATDDGRLEQVMSRRLSLLNAALQQQAIDEASAEALRDQVLRHLNETDKFLDVTLPAWNKAHALKA